MLLNKRFGVWGSTLIARAVILGRSLLMSLMVSSSVSCDAADSEGKPSDDGEEHWTQWSAYQAVKDPHQPSQAGWCMYYDKLSLILFFLTSFYFFWQFHNSLLFDVPYTPPQSPLKKLIKKREELEEEPPEKEELDWWSRYYASLEELERKVSQTEMMDVKNRLFNSSGSLLLKRSQQYNIED